MTEGPVRDALNLPNVRTIRHVVADEQNIYEAQSVEPVGTSCCLLFEVDRSLNGFKPQTYLDTAREGRPSVIHFKVRRWRCRACSRSVYENLSWVARRQGMTARLAAWTFRQATIRSFSQVAAELGIEPKTVARCFMLHAIPEVRKLRLATPRVLGMDEKHLFGGMRAVFGNVEEKTIYWMLKERNRATLTPFFKKMRDKDQVEVVTIDMYRPYVGLLHEYFPQATIVIDKYHIIRYATLAIDRGRAALRKGGQPIDQRRKLTNQRWTLLKRRHNWDDRDRARFEGWRVEYPELVEIYELKEAAHEIFDRAYTRDQAMQAYIEWRKALPAKYKPAFKPFTRAMTNWGEYIFNYFDHRYTNAYIERLNGIIDDANRVGRGYRFATLFLKIMINHGRRKPPVKKINRNPNLLDGVIDDPMTMGFMGAEGLFDLLGIDAVEDHGVPLSTFERLLRDPSFW